MARIGFACDCLDFPCCGCDEVAYTGEDALEAMMDEDERSLFGMFPDDDEDEIDAESCADDEDAALVAAGYDLDWNESETEDWDLTD